MSKEYGHLALTLRVGDVVQVGPDSFIVIEKLGASKSLIIIRAPKEVQIKRLGKLGKDLKGII